MDHDSIGAFIDATRPALQKGPVALIMAEDPVALASTLVHHLELGFPMIAAFCPPEIRLPREFSQTIHRISHDTRKDDAVPDAINRVIEAAPGSWIYYCYNAEYLFFPFCETRSIRELLAFHTEERRDSMLTYVIDLYAGDLDRYPDAVAPSAARMDRSGYYALGRGDPANAWKPKERQMDFFGGLRWRFEEHVPFDKRRIDRIGLFRAQAGLRLRGDHTFNIDEYNTFACPWHNNLTATICSFRTAKALRTNPGSRFDIQTFNWRNSVQFEWHSQQLMDLGLMEPGQWF